MNYDAMHKDNHIFVNAIEFEQMGPIFCQYS